MSVYVSYVPMNQNPVTVRNVIVLAMMFVALPALADTTAQRQKHYNLKNNLAIKGYDPVAYFSGEERKGRPDHTLRYLGVTYHFSSAENLEKFKASPSKYEPQFGGWCAYGFAIKAGKVKINPKSFKIIDGKLYLFYHTGPWANTLKKWNRKPDEPQLKIAKAEWKNLVG